MTIAAANSKVIYAGDGVTTAFPYAFKINTTDGSDLQVSVIDDLGNVTLLTGNYSVDVANAKVNYPTVAGVAPLGVGVTALPANWNLVINRVEPLSQVVSLSDQGFSLAALEAGLDKVTMILQQLQEQVNRSFKLPIGNTPTSADVTVKSVVISTGNLIGNITLSDTYDNLKAHPPAAATFAWATDIGAGALVFYSGNPAIGDLGWFGPIVGGAQ